MAISPRRITSTVDVGGVKVGSDNPIVVQSMTNTDTADVTGTVNQVMALAQGRLGTGARHGQHRRGCGSGSADRRHPESVWRARPHHRRLPLQRPSSAEEVSRIARARLAKYRINPGNVNIGKKHDDNFRTMIEAAIEYDRPVRIGVNWGSLDQRAADAHDGRELAAAGAARTPRRHDRRHRRQRAALRRSGRAVRPARATRSSSAPKSAACRI